MDIGQAISHLGSVPEPGPVTAAMMAMQAAGLRRVVPGRKLGPFDVEVAAGELVALVGGNGSGKTTCLRLMLGLDRASAGLAQVAGHAVNPLQPPRGIGYVPDQPQFWDWRSGRDNLRPFAPAADAVQALLDQLGLGEAGRTAVRKYSRGMRQRLALARALAATPPILVLDEPTIALDSGGVDLLVEILLARRAAGHTGLVATHDAAFLERLAPRQIEVLAGRTTT